MERIVRSQDHSDFLMASSWFTPVEDRTIVSQQDNLSHTFDYHVSSSRFKILIDFLYIFTFRKK